MNRGPVPGAKTKADFVAKARAAYGDEMPDWVEELAIEATNTSAKLAAEKIGYSPSLISHVFAKTYSGDLARVEEKVRGALMGVTVMCPILGEIGRDVCLDEQKKPRRATSSVRSKLYRACRSGCPHSRIKEH
ncbi:hypothetical protein AFEL58S_01971 [Afipia felis]